MTSSNPRWIEDQPLDDLSVARWNPKLHDAQLIGDSIGEHGFVNAVVVDERTGDLVAGHGRRDDLLARRAAGEDPPEGVMLGDGDVWLVPVQRGWRSKSKRQAEKYLVADNATTAAAGWAPRRGTSSWCSARVTPICAKTGSCALGRTSSTPGCASRWPPKTTARWSTRATSSRAAGPTTHRTGRSTCGRSRSGCTTCAAWSGTASPTVASSTQGSGSSAPALPCGAPPSLVRTWPATSPRRPAGIRTGPTRSPALLTEQGHIIDAHRAASKRNHPDLGGSTATQAYINAARDHLLATL